MTPLPCDFIEQSPALALPSMIAPLFRQHVIRRTAKKQGRTGDAPILAQRITGAWHSKRLRRRSKMGSRIIRTGCGYAGIGVKAGHEAVLKRSEVGCSGPKGVNRTLCLFFGQT